MFRLFLVPLVPSAIGVLLALNALAAPFGNTGVDGTLGAWLAFIGAVFVALSILLILSLAPAQGRWRLAATLLALLAAILTGIAAFFLMQTLLAVTMVLTVIALGYAAISRERTLP